MGRKKKLHCIKQKHPRRRRRLATPRSARVWILTGKMWDENSRKSARAVDQRRCKRSKCHIYWILSHFGPNLRRGGGEERKTMQELAQNRAVSKLSGMGRLFSSVPSSHDEHIPRKHKTKIIRPSVREKKRKEKKKAKKGPKKNNVISHKFLTLKHGKMERAK